MEMALCFPFIFLVERSRGFQCSEKTVLIKAKSSHLLLNLIKTSHNIKLTHIFQCNEIYLSLNIINGTFSGVHIDQCLSVITENPS